MRRVYAGNALHTYYSLGDEEEKAGRYALRAYRYGHPGAIAFLEEYEQFCNENSELPIDGEVVAPEDGEPGEGGKQEIGLRGRLCASFEHNG